MPGYSTDSRQMDSQANIHSTPAGIFASYHTTPTPTEPNTNKERLLISLPANTSEADHECNMEEIARLCLTDYLQSTSNNAPHHQATTTEARETARLHAQNESLKDQVGQYKDDTCMYRSPTISPTVRVLVLTRLL